MEPSARSHGPRSSTVTVAELLARYAGVSAPAPRPTGPVGAVSVAALLRREGRGPHVADRPLQPRGHARAALRPPDPPRRSVRKVAVAAGALFAATAVLGPTVVEDSASRSTTGEGTGLPLPPAGGVPDYDWYSDAERAGSADADADAMMSASMQQVFAEGIPSDVGSPTLDQPAAGSRNSERRHHAVRHLQTPDKASTGSTDPTVAPESGTVPPRGAGTPPGGTWSGAAVPFSLASHSTFAAGAAYGGSSGTWSPGGRPPAGVPGYPWSNGTGSPSVIPGYGLPSPPATGHRAAGNGPTSTTPATARSHNGDGPRSGTPAGAWFSDSRGSGVSSTAHGNGRPDGRAFGSGQDNGPGGGARPAGNDGPQGSGTSPAATSHEPSSPDRPAARSAKTRSAAGSRAAVSERSRGSATPDSDDGRETARSRPRGKSAHSRAATRNESNDGGSGRPDRGQRDDKSDRDNSHNRSQSENSDNGKSDNDRGNSGGGDRGNSGSDRDGGDNDSGNRGDSDPGGGKHRKGGGD